MATTKLNGYLGILVIPDDATVNVATALTEIHGIAKAEHVTKPKGMHITLYQAKNFVGLPVSFAHKLVDKLNQLLVEGRHGPQALRLARVAPNLKNGQYLFWKVEVGPNEARLMTAHRMSLALSAWNDPVLPDPNANDLVRLFGADNVLENYVPHITLAANTKGFPTLLKSLSKRYVGTAARVVLARMGKWGKIKKILF